MSPAGACFTRSQWATDLLTALDEPRTEQNVEALVSWASAEGGGGTEYRTGMPGANYPNAAKFNLLNTARVTDHSFVAIGLDGIRGYDSYQDGINATVETLHNGLYGGILAALNRSDDVQAVLTAAGQSRWAASHYRGTDWPGIRVSARNQMATAKC